MTTELTPREMDVLRHADFSNWEIAQRLGVSVQTVKNGWTGIYRKLLGPDFNRHSPRRTAALVEALQRGIISVGDLHKGPRRRA